MLKALGLLYGFALLTGAVNGPGPKGFVASKAVSLPGWCLGGLASGELRAALAPAFWTGIRRPSYSPKELSAGAR